MATGRGDHPGRRQRIRHQRLRDGAPMTTLSNKLYRHAHNKIARLSDAETTMLRARFA